MRIASYNIRKAVGLDWRRDGDRIVSVLEEINADVVVLQESDKRIGQRAGVLPLDRTRQELGYGLAGISTRPHSHGWHGNAIFYRCGTVELSHTRRIDLPSLEPRGAVCARLAAPSMEVIGVHLALTRRTRLKQLTALKDHLDTVQCPVVIAGDFNAWHPDANIIRTLGKDCEMILPGNSFHASRPMAALDRFILKGKIGHISSYVHHSSLAARASDHLPIVMDLEFLK